MGQHWNQDYVFDIGLVSYVHIPRTGGTTLRKVLSKHVVSNKLFGVDIGQHMPISSRCDINKGYKYFTFLRNPLERVESHYTLLRTIEGNKWDGYIGDFDSLCSACWTLNNLSCQMISGQIKTRVTDDIFNLAKRNLERFYFVGDFSTFNDSVINFVFRLTGKKISACDIPIVNSMGQLNAVKNITKCHRIKLSNMNYYDSELYKYFQDTLRSGRTIN